MFIRYSHLCAATFAAAGALLSAQSAEAQTGTDSAFQNQASSQAVATRPRPEYDAIGMRAGSFVLFPSVTQGVGIDTNVFEAPQQTKEKGIFYEIAPRLALVSNWSRHALQITAGSESIFYVDGLASENQTDWDINANGRLDIGARSSVTVNSGYQVRHEGRGDVNNPLPAGALPLPDEPVQYGEYNTGVRYANRINRLSYNFGVEYTTREYANKSSISGQSVPGGGRFGTIPAIDPSGNPITVEVGPDRDVTTWAASGEVGYDFSPGYIGFVRGTLNKRNFEQEFDRNGNDRDSSGFEVLSGLRFELTNLLVGDVSAGYIKQSFNDDPRLDDVSGMSVNVGLEWYPSPLLTVRTNAQRAVIDTVVANAAGEFSTSYGAGFDYEFRRNVIVSGDASIRDSSFEGTGREDDTYTVNLSTDYLINRRARAGVFYDFVQRQSNAALQDYTQHVIGVNLTLQL